MSFASYAEWLDAYRSYLKSKDAEQIDYNTFVGKAQTGEIVWPPKKKRSSSKR